MGLQLSGLFQNQNQVSGVNQTGAGSGVRVSSGTITRPDSGEAASGVKTLGSFQPGSSLTGQVVSSQDGTVTIRLADSSLVSASLKAGISLNAGSRVTFMVNSNHNNQIVLSPLYTNLTQSTNVENALKAAELPLNTQTAGMVETMMEQGMSIDKNSLLAMYKQVAANPDIDSAAVVKLTQMDLAVNELNANQLTAYENLNHQLAGSVDEITNGLQQAFAGANDGNLDSLMQLFDGVMDLVQTQDTAAFTEAGALSPENGALQEAAGQNAAGELIGDFLDAQSLQELSGALEAAGADEGAVLAAAKGELSADEALRTISNLLQGGGPEETETAQATLPGQTQQLTQETAAQLLQNRQTLLQDRTALFKELLSSPAVGRLFQEVLQKKFLMEPKDVGDKEKVDAFYEQLKSQTAKLSSLAADTLGREAPLTQSANRLSQNIDFLNQLNQTFTYVQIPLKMSGQNANGDLYVYTNKKNLAARDGNVSAFLHLDMDHLGGVDVYVTMEKQRVSTNFKVRDDEVLDLIEEHIDWLNERLQNRGYQLHATVAKQEEETSVIHEMQKQMGQTSMPIAQTSFDARA